MKLSCNNHISSFTRQGALEDTIFPLSDAELGIPAGEYTFIYDYPLSMTVKFVHELGNDTSVIDILLEARADYRTIYALEDASSETRASLIPGTLNRAATNGFYGIWGHTLSDLYFEGVIIDIQRQQIEFSIGS